MLHLSSGFIRIAGSLLAILGFFLPWYRTSKARKSSFYILPLTVNQIKQGGWNIGLLFPYWLIFLIGLLSLIISIITFNQSPAQRDVFLPITLAIIGLIVLVIVFALVFYLIIGLQLSMAYAISEEEKKESLCTRNMTLLEFIITGTWLTFTRSGFWLMCLGFLALFIGILNP